MRRLASGLVAALALWGATGTPEVRAQAADPRAALTADQKKELRAAFQEMFRDPANLDKTFRYAEIAARAGDFEGAVSALERMLLFNPDLPRVRLELGVLYFRLGSFSTARSYFQQVLAAREATPEVRERVTAFMKEIDNRATAHRLTGTLTVGVRAQTNATAAPGSSVVDIGLREPLRDLQTGESDVNLFAAGTVTSIYDFQTEPDLKLESTVNLFASRQREQSQLDTRVAELRSGPRFALESGEEGDASLWPFAIAGYVDLNRHPYLYYYGGGVELRRTLTDRIAGEVELAHRRRSYRNSGEHPDVEERDGGQTTGTVTTRVAVHDGGLVTLTGLVEREGTETAALGNWEAGGSLGYLLVYGAPFGLTSQPWTSGVNAFASRSWYDEVNPAYAALDARVDREYRLGFLTSVPVTDSFALQLTAQRTVVNSNNPLFTYDDSLVSVAGSWKF